MIKSRSIRWVKHRAYMGNMRNAYKTLVRKPNGRTSLERPWQRQEDNIRFHLRDTGWVDVDLIHLAQNSDKWQVCVNMVMNLQQS
jgi:hypothetical protein